jgi:hypothetical protein
MQFNLCSYFPQNAIYFKIPTFSVWIVIMFLINHAMKLKYLSSCIMVNSKMVQEFKKHMDYKPKIFFILSQKKSTIEGLLEL